MKKLLVAVTVSVFAVVLLAGLAQAAAPSVLGTWKGSAPKITSAAVCSTTAVTLSVTKQCGNLFAGKATITGSTVAIPFVGRLIYDSKTAIYSITIEGGYQMTTSPFTFIYLYLVGTYVPGSPAKILATSFDYYSSTTTISTLMFDTFTLTKQQ